MNVDTLISLFYEVTIPTLFSRQWENINNNKSFVRKKDGKNKELKIAVDGYRENILKFQKKVLMKNTVFTHKSQVELFENDIHIILLRNTFNLFVSVEKSIYNFRHENLKTLLKRTLRPLYSLYYLNFWAKNLLKSLKALNGLNLKDNILIVRYENLKNLETQKKIFEIIDSDILLEKPVEIKENNISSFSKKEYGSPLKRYEKAPFWLKIIIQVKLGKLDKQLRKF